MLAYEMRRANLTPFMAVLELITHVIHPSTLHFAVARSKFITVILGKKLTGKSVKHIEQYHITLVEKLHYLKRRGREAFVEPLFSRLHSGVTVLCTLSPTSFFPSDKKLLILFKLKKIICTLLLRNKNYRSPCPFKRKRAFISLSSLA